MATQYETQLVTQYGSGMQDYINQQRGMGKSGALKGTNVDAQDVDAIVKGYGQGTSTPAQTIQQGLQSLSSAQYQFDPNAYLPGIKTQAASIYDPQQAQLEALRTLQGEQYKETKVQTIKDFEDQMAQEKEAINNRGSFFSGGAIDREQDLGDKKLSALNMLGLQASAADFNNLAQQGLLEAEEAQFIQDRLYNAEAGAYSRWTDQRNFSYQTLLSQYQVYSNERDFARSVFESDRGYNLQVEQLDDERERFEKQYNLSKKEFEMAKEEFKVNLDIKKLNYEDALADFKKKYASTNYGILGSDSSGNDKLETYRNSWKEVSGYDNSGLTFDNQTSLGGLSFGW